LRLLLDANLSPRRVAAQLRKTGHHDILALAEDAAYEGLPDPQVLELATFEERVLITRNSRDFAPIAREWAEARRSHTGLILIWTLDHSQFAAIVTGIEHQLDLWPSQEQWRDLTVAF
jgi:predicted nuclease of predicted toxin-antitoxin system